uniref:Uncharacterized protein n=1 Tax=Megaselia scalaris TaxID=36166 RepID=T1GTT5_MEGSC
MSNTELYPMKEACSTFGESEAAGNLVCNGGFDKIKSFIIQPIQSLAILGHRSFLEIVTRQEERPLPSNSARV